MSSARVDRDIISLLISSISSFSVAVTSCSISFISAFEGRLARYVGMSGASSESLSCSSPSPVSISGVCPSLTMRLLSGSGVCLRSSVIKPPFSSKASHAPSWLYI
ncbi:hypothetical protein XENTR_v10020949 [Xenopus tropicalis]|nr:hypothetical protein XENTR_v10020949 [Xenopus tropicalis]